MQLHKRDVVEAATAILDNYGIADLTMRRLGRELNVSPGALYWHFANKQQLLGAIADRILEPVDDAPGDWRDRVAGICGRLRDALLSHNDGAELVSASFAAGQSDAMTAIVGRLRDAASDAGVEDAHAELAARTVVYYVLGFTVDEQSRLQWDAAGAELPDEQSVLTDDAGERFGFGLALLIDGIAARRPVVGERTTNVAGMISVADVRRITSTLPRSYEVVVRDRIKFRVGQIVYLAFSRDETVMGFAFPKEEREGLIASDPDKFMLPRPSDMRYDWVHVRLDAIDHAELREIVVEAWRMCVPKSVAATVP